MSNFLEIALRNASRGFRVIPLRGKDAFLRGWPTLGTTDEPAIRAWAEQFPDNNCGVCGGSDVVILDSDRVSRLKEICGAKWEEWSQTYSVTSGRPDRAHFYYRGTDEVLAWGNKKWSEAGIDGNIFEIKGHGCLVVAEGSLHPDSGTTYRITQDISLIPFPSGLLTVLREFSGKDNAQRERVPHQKIGEGGRHDALVREAGAILAVTEMDKGILAEHLQNFNEQWCDPPLSEGEVEQIALTCNWAPNAKPPSATIGKPEEKPTVTDWRELFHTREECENAPPISFLIDAFLQREGVTGLAAPVRERKSLIALNVAHALVTGEKLFDHFTVTKRPDRVLYLCPEMALGPFSDRLKKIGLLDYVGERLFYRTLSKDGKLRLLDDALRPALPGSLVILDTAVRFLEGDEDSSSDMRLFADELFALLRVGAEAVFVLYHSPKSQGNADMMTLENALRGSGDLGAALACCWGTRLQDVSKPYESASYMANLKMRDFESKPFEVTSGPDCRLHIVSEPGDHVTLKPRTGNRANKDGKDEAAEAVIRANPKMNVRELSELLASLGMKRGKTWVGQARSRINGTGVTTRRAPGDLSTKAANPPSSTQDRQSTHTTP